MINHLCREENINYGPKINPCGTLCFITPQFENAFVVDMRKPYCDETMINSRKKKKLNFNIKKPENMWFQFC